MSEYATKIEPVLNPAILEDVRQSFVAEGRGALWDDPEWREREWREMAAERRWNLRQKVLHPRLRQQAIEGVIQQLILAGRIVADG